MEMKVTRKEFLKRVNKFRRKTRRFNYNLFTCTQIKYHISSLSGFKYQEFIKRFLDRYCEIQDKYYCGDKAYYPMLLRCMLTEAFFDECLRTKKYKEF